MVSQRRTGRPSVVLARAFIYAALLVVIAVSLFPIYFALATSLKPTREAFTSPPTWIFKIGRASCRERVYALV